MLRHLYAALVRLHPPSFRRNYGPEMLSIFDHTPGSDRAPLLTDAAISLLRQRLLRPEFHHPEEPLPQPPAVAPLFLVLDDDPRLTPAQWIGGASLSLLAWTAVALLIGHATLHLDAINAGPIVTGDERRYLTAYFDSVLVLRALDVNHDFVISAREIANARSILPTLDLDHDGSLDAKECGVDLSGPYPVPDFMHFHPVLAALDTNHDGLISAAEIANAPRSLETLDRNHDGEVSAREVLP